MIRKLFLSAFFCLLAIQSLATITGTFTVCAGSSTTLTDGTGGTWSSGNTSVATIGAVSGASVVVNGVVAGTAIISYQYGGSYDIATVTVNTPPIVGPNTLCANSTVTYTDPTSGGTWSCGPYLTVNAATGVVTAGPYPKYSSTISYSLGSCKATMQVTIVITPAGINDLPNALSILCLPYGTETLSDDSVGGTWGSSIPGVASIGETTGFVTALSQGTTTITYTIPDGCYVTKLTTIDSAISPITGSLSVCVGAQSTLADADSSGIWTSSNLAVGTIHYSSSRTIVGISAGTTIITYTPTGYGIYSGCFASAVVTVGAAPISGTLSVCAGTTTTLTDGSGTGTWTSSHTGIATVGASTGVVTGVSQGTTTISYTSASGCTATTIVTVLPLPSAGTISGTLTVCVGSNTTLSDGVSGGSWSSGETAIATVNAATGAVTGVSPGTAAISYTVTNSCGTAVATAIVIVNPLPNAGSISGTLTVCAGSATTLSDGVSGGLWSSGETAIATVNAVTGTVTGVSPGTAAISYTVTNSCGTAVAIAIVTVNPLPDAGTISGTLTVCTSSTTPLSDGVSGGSWSSGETAVATVNAATGTVTGVSPGTAVISYIITNSCGTAVATAIVTVNSLPDAGSITGPDTVCIGATITLSDGTGGGSWSSTNSSVATVSGTGVVIGVGAGETTISYVFTNSCGPAVATATVTTRYCCLTDTLVINTGYDPIGDTAITGESTDSTAPVTDPKWVLTAITDNASSAISASGFTQVIIDSSADIVNSNLPFYTDTDWAANSNSGWITAQNAHGYKTYMDNTDSFSMTLSRPFYMCDSDSIAINVNIATDNYILSADIDGTVLPTFTQVSGDYSAYSNAYSNLHHFQNFSDVVYLPASGTAHRLNIVVVNYNYPESTIYNPTGLNLYGRLYSATGRYSLVRENDAVCATYSCSYDGRHANPVPAQTVPQAPGSLVCFPNPNNGTFTLEGTLAKTNSKEASIAVMDMLGKVVYVDQAAIVSGGINKNITLGNYLPNGIYLIKITDDVANYVLRFNLNR